MATVGCIFNTSLNKNNFSHSDDHLSPHLTTTPNSVSNVLKKLPLEDHYKNTGVAPVAAGIAPTFVVGIAIGLHLLILENDPFRMFGSKQVLKNFDISNCTTLIVLGLFTQVSHGFLIYILHATRGQHLIMLSAVFQRRQNDISHLREGPKELGY